MSRPRPLTGARAFRRVLKIGARRRSDLFVVVVAPSEDGATRVGFVIGKQLGNAVTRNRVRRRLRAALGEVDLGKGHEYVIMARAGLIDAPYDRIVGALAETIQGAT